MPDGPSRPCSAPSLRACQLRLGADNESDGTGPPEDDASGDDDDSDVVEGHVLQLAVNAMATAGDDSEGEGEGDDHGEG